MNHTVQEKNVSLGAAALLVFGLYALLFCYTAHAYVPPNPVKLPFEAHADGVIRQILPQGWGFFTKSPRDEEFYIYRRTAHGWQNAFDGPQATPRNFLGLSRATRAEGGELGLLTMGIDSKAFLTCRTSNRACIERQRRVIKVVNTQPNPFYCGEIALAYRKPVPWLWQYEFKGVSMPVRVLRMNVTCR